jgi:hypothetical protein
MVRTALYSNNLIERLMVRQQNKSKKNRTKPNKSALEKSRRLGRQRGVTTGLRKQIDHGPKRSAISTIGVAR